MLRSVRPLVVALALTLSVPAYAAELPNNFLGNWTKDEITNVTVGPQSYDEPGHHCVIKSITAKRDLTDIDTNVYIVSMSCNDDGQDLGPVREMWSLRKISGAGMLIVVGISGATYPSIMILQRSK